MDERPVGLFDSGLGGISVLRQAMRVLPDESYVYYGDTAHIPYGDKPAEVIIGYCREAMRYLTEEARCKAVVIACNTATAAAAEVLRAEYSLPIIGIEPALKPAELMDGDGNIVVMATHTALSLPKFGRLMERYGQHAIPVPCPGLMECVENGDWNNDRIHTLLDKLLADLPKEHIKAVVLGCTHYPFVKQAIAAHFPEDTPMIDGGEGTARQLRRRLEECNLLSSGPSRGVALHSTAPGQEEKMLRLLHTPLV